MSLEGYGPKKQSEIESIKFEDFTDDELISHLKELHNKLPELPEDFDGVAEVSELDFASASQITEQMEEIEKILEARGVEFK